MHRNPLSRWLTAALGLVVLALLASGAWFLNVQEQGLRRETEADLGAIARLKVDQITQWRAERLADAAVIAKDPFLVEVIARWLAAPQVEDAGQILAYFRSLQEHYHYYDVLLADAEGQVRLSLGGYVGPLHDDVAQAQAAALADRRPALSRLHAGPGDLPPHIDTIAPLFAGQAGTSEPLGAIILQSDARQFLYPLIQTWPTPSDSAETLLVRREGDEVLFLNDLRFQPGAALTLRFPLDQADLPAVMAVQGREGVVQGVDYRGVEVLAALQAVPDSPWFLVAKMDEAEALATLRRETTLILALLLGLVFTAAVGGAAIWQRSAAAHYRAVYQAEQRHRVTLMSVGDGVITTDVEGQVELLNPAAEALTGWSQAEARGERLAEVFHIVDEETRRPAEDPVHRVLREGRVVGLANHTLLLARDGTARPIADSGAPIRDEKGEISGVVLVFQDQTEERAAQKALRESQELNQAIIDCSPLALYSIDLEGDVLSWNASAERIFGWTADEVIGKPLPIVPPDKEKEFASLRERLRAGQGFSGMEIVRQKKDGTRFTASLSTAPLYDDQGNIYGIMAALEDITERKRAEAEREAALEALRESEDKFKHVFEAANVGKSITLPGGEINVNQAFADMLGYTREELSGRTWQELTPADEIESIQKMLAPLLEGKKGADRLTKRYLHKDGSHVWADVSVAMRRDDAGRPLYFVTTIVDISRRKRAEEEIKALNAELEARVKARTRELHEAQEQLVRQERLAVLGQLAGGIGHELRNPLGVISNAVYFLKLVQPDASDEAQEYLHILESEARNAAKIVDDLLDFARIKSVDREPVSAEELAAAALARYPAPAGVDVMLDFPAALPALHVDPGQMQQVLGNLLTNAYQAMPGGGALTISARQEDRVVAFSVADTGAGIPPQTLDKIFEPLFTTRARGIGLGLAVSHNLVEANDGRIEVDSKPGKGSTFTLFLPKAKDG